MEKAPSDVELLTVKGAAEAMALRACTVRKWILERKIPYTRIGKRAIRIPKAWVRQQIQAGWHAAIKDGAPTT